MSSVKENKAFQTIVGAGVIYIGFVLWRDGWVEWAFSSQPQEGFGNGQLLVALGAAILSFVQLVGIVTIGIVSGVLPHLDGLGDKAAELIRRGLASARGALSDYRNRDKPERSWDWKPLAAIILAVVLLRGGVLPKIVSVV
ncbi:MAG: hypothetical protein GY906_16075, partial [bacterium]|nr:hypothetical protein [bacterium]